MMGQTQHSGSIVRSNAARNKVLIKGGVPAGEDQRLALPKRAKEASLVKARTTRTG